DSYFEAWKANANGVDLNRNFDALWTDFKGNSQPSSELYKGIKPECEQESAAIGNLTREKEFDATISYHSHGNVIYWYFGQSGVLFDQTKSLADKVSKVTGYPLDSDYKSLDPAGFKDWAIDKLHIPSLTIEIGADTSPIPLSQLPKAKEQNRDVLPESLEFIKSL
ncbi:MAG: peptidase, partial [Clostridia bacterium]|nr:peptidase [Clostridia bacterium]